MDETPPPSRPPVVLAGAARDAVLGLSKALSREEVLRRRRRRLLQLYSLYRAQYWALADELPAKHGEYWWEHGASPVLPEEQPPGLPPPPPSPAQDNSAGVGVLVNNGGGAEDVENIGFNAAAPSSAGARAGCAASNCEAKAMPLSQYCFDHILFDCKQQLYQPCSLVTKRSGAPDGEATCGKPALRGITPLRCSNHNPKSHKLIIEALQNAGIDLPLTCAKVHLICER
ncbi:hypothetical protein PR202_gb00201 [Eleusine coracana subsp. coracana]|uniref:KAT8 regulatory NSL complex subunit 2 n=1 Tax=Eleusine coracana subsp. coracana TaxID=191504 RepID=A0AAV5DTK6_ELECO|nr:hypothetical protein QOZ80_5BG0433100 [Eleusine coracana subsp. coracana]GJN13491.1 hypothetical protein PR202_gb00201 [Eleusine coracana subsp. coracana]